MNPTITLDAVALDPTWIAGRAFRLRIVLTNRGPGPVTLARPDEPSRALAFAVVAPGRAPTDDDWRDGAAYMTLAGAHGHPGVELPVSLGAGASMEAVWSLDAFVAPPSRGRWAAHVRQRVENGDVVFATPVEVEVADAGFVAADAACVASSGRWLVHACADGASITVRSAQWAAPAGVTQHRAVGVWNVGAGTHVAVAAHAFSPLDDPPLSAFRHAVAWCDAAVLHFARVAWNGVVEAHTAVTHGLGAPRLCTPVQFEDGGAALALHEARDGAQRVVWVRVEAAGATAVLAVQDLPGDARGVQVCATPRGDVRVLWVDATLRRVWSQAPPWHAAHGPAVTPGTVDGGAVAYFEAHDPRDASALLAVTSDEQPGGARTLTVGELRDGVWTALGAVFDDRGGGGAVRAVVPAQGPAVVAVRDPAGGIWVATVGGALRRVEGLVGTLAWGLTEGPYAVTVWGADAREGLRFVPLPAG